MGKLYEIEIKSEDSVAATYYLNTRNRDKGGDGALRSLKVEGTAVTLKHPRGHADTAFMNVVETADTVTVEWETTDDNALVTVSPRDTDSGEDGHQFAVSDTANAERTLAIRVVSEDRSDTAHYGLVVQRANNVATLKSLSADVGLKEKFDPATTSYTADAAHDDAEVVFTFAPTDSDASTKPTSPHTATLGAAGTKTPVSIVATAEDGSTSQTYTVTVTKGPAPPTAETRILFISKDGSDTLNTLTRAALDIEEGTTSAAEDTTYWVSLWTNPDTTVTVTIAPTSSGDLTVVEPSGGTLEFTSDTWDTPQRVALTAAEDADAEPDAEIGLTHTAADNDGTDSDYHEHADTLDVTITENDTKGVTLSATGKEVTEGASGTYTVVLTSQPTGNVNIEISGAPSDVTVTEQLTFTSGNWETAQTVTINTANAADDEDNGNETFTLDHGVLGGGYTGVTIDDVGATVMDTSAAQVVITTTAVTVNEDVEFTYNIALTQEPSDGETVTVDLSYSTGDFTGTTSVALTSSNAIAGEPVTLTARNVTADAVKTISYTVSVADDDDTDTQVYDGTETATSTTVTVKNVPE